MGKNKTLLRLHRQRQRQRPETWLKVSNFYFLANTCTSHVWSGCEQLHPATTISSSSASSSSAASIQLVSACLSFRSSGLWIFVFFDDAGAVPILLFLAWPTPESSTRLHFGILQRSFCFRIFFILKFNARVVPHISTMEYNRRWGNKNAAAASNQGVPRGRRCFRYCCYCLVYPSWEYFDLSHEESEQMVGSTWCLENVLCAGPYVSF